MGLTMVIICVVSLLVGSLVALSLFLPVLVAAALFVPLEPVSAIVMSLFMAARGKWVAYAAITAHLASSLIVGVSVAFVFAHVLLLMTD